MNPEDLGYRSPIDTTPVKVPDADSDNFSTLTDVYKKFKVEMKNLQHINAFDTLKAENKTKAAQVLLRQVDAKQEAFRILEPLFLQLESAVQDIEKVQKGES